MKISTLFNTVKYAVSKKGEPVFNDYSKIITNFSTLTPKIKSEFDMSGMQYYDKGPSKDGLFVCEKMTLQDQILTRLLFDVSVMGDDPKPIPQYPWIYRSEACNSHDLFRIDIYHPGRIIMKCTLPKYVWVSGWLYVGMQKSDSTNPYLLTIDKFLIPRDYYFEVDMVETFMNPRSLAFNGHYGVGDPLVRKMQSAHLLWNREGYHYPEIIWDGSGGWIWKMDGVTLHEDYLVQPKQIYPYFLLTLSMSEDYPIERLEWKVDYVKFSKVIDLPKLS